MKAIIGGKVFTVTGETYDNGVILFENGKIVAVGTDVAIPEGTEIIDATGKWVTPGLIDAHSHISGLNEPNTLPGMHDVNEITSPITAHVRAYDFFNPHEASIPVARSGGFTTCCTLPGSANLIGGTGFVFKLKEASTVQEMEIPGTTCMKMALGENPRRCYSAKNVIPSTRMGNGAVMREALYNAKVYSDALKAAETDPSKAPKPDFKLDALVPVVRGEMQVRIHSHRADDIVTATRVAEEFGLKYSIEHCTEGYKIKDYLSEKNIFCVIGPLLLDQVKQEVWGIRLDNAAQLVKAGVKICLTEDAAGDTRWLPYEIGACIARSELTEEEALTALTINPATLLGVADRVGSIEVGKDADFAIFTGSPFDTANRCVATIIEGVVYNH